MVNPELVADPMKWIEERGIRSIRIEGTNLDGAFIGKVVSPAKFKSGLVSGFAFADVAFGLDMGATPYFGFAWPSWRGDLADIFLRLDTSTLIEWAPGRASVMGDFWGETEPISACPRSALRRVTRDLEASGYTCKVAIEVEATVFQESVYEARLKGYRDLTPLGGTSGSAYNFTKSKDWEEYLVAVSDRLDELGIDWEAWNDEAAAGQIEINIAPGDPIEVADNWARTRQVMREVANEQGRVVTFMAKWSDEWGQASHINLSLERDGANAFYDPEGPSQDMLYFLGGLMATIEGTTSFSMPWITSFRRLAEFQGPPTTTTWGINNKSTAIRAVTKHPKYSRLEYRVPGSDANIYLVLATVIGTGLAGIKGKLEPPAAYPSMAWGDPERIGRLPNSITKAVEALRSDPIIRQVMGSELVDYWAGTRIWEWWSYHNAGGNPDSPVTQWESTRYFEMS